MTDEEDLARRCSCSGKSVVVGCFHRHLDCRCDAFHPSTVRIEIRLEHDGCERYDAPQLSLGGDDSHDSSAASIVAVVVKREVVFVAAAAASVLPAASGM